MATAVRKTTAVKKTDNDQPQRWAPPTSDEEFVFEGIDSLPGWADKNWAAWDGGPALAVPTGDVYGGPGPYTTKVASIGDTVVFKSATYAKAAHFDIVKGTPSEEQSTPKPPQQSGASYEDLIRGGWINKADLSEADKAGISARSPGMRQYFETDQQPVKVKVQELLILS